jgi:NitT/TauT family transport system permease protein
MTGTQAAQRATPLGTTGPDASAAQPNGQARPQGRPRRRIDLGPVLLALPVPLLVLGVWHVGVQQSWTLPFGIQMAYLPAPVEVGRRLVDLAAGGVYDDAFSGTLWAHLWASTQRVLWGFAVAVAVAVPLGIAMGRFTVVGKLFDPAVNLIRPIPVTAWAPLTLLIIGFGDRSTIFLVFLAAFFPVLLNTIAGVRQVPPRLLEAASMLGTGPVHALHKVVLPAAMPSIVSGLRVALGLSWVILVVGETVGINTGLGAMITQARDMSNTGLIVCGMVVIGLAGFLADRALQLLLRLVTRGRPTLLAEEKSA